MNKHRFKLLLFIVLLAMLGLAYYSFVGQSKKNTVEIKNTLFNIDLAVSADDLERGLSGRKEIANDQAMLFIFSDKSQRSFWMKDMNFNIDLLWIDGNKIVGYEKNMLAPEDDTPLDNLAKYTSSQPVDKVLEIKAGLIDSLGIKIGDTIEFES
jgi:hypothetical protein